MIFTIEGFWLDKKCLKGKMLDLNHGPFTDSNAPFHCAQNDLLIGYSTWSDH
ncbi:MAG: hypothetical protein ACI81Y_000815 [Glaciecola sp.]|jgi:hypothetical protein